MKKCFHEFLAHICFVACHKFMHDLNDRPPYVEIWGKATENKVIFYWNMKPVIFQPFAQKSSIYFQDFTDSF